MVVPAILSCQDCVSLSQPTQKNPRKQGAADRKAARVRIKAIEKFIGRPSSRTHFNPSTMPPTVVLFQAHMAMW